MTTKVAYRVLVSGQVQGVGYRDFCQQLADQRQVTGWVKNLPDGRVEAFLCGERDAVEGMLEDLKAGPAAASISEVDATEFPYQPFRSFSIAF